MLAATKERECFFNPLPLYKDKGQVTVTSPIPIQTMQCNSLLGTRETCLNVVSVRQQNGIVCGLASLTVAKRCLIYEWLRARSACMLFGIT